LTLQPTFRFGWQKSYNEVSGILEQWVNFSDWDSPEFTAKYGCTMGKAKFEQLVSTRIYL